MTDATIRTAVVFVHGLPHERRPLDTLDAFAKAALGPDAVIHPRPVEITDSLRSAPLRHRRTGRGRGLRVRLALPPVCQPLRRTRSDGPATAAASAGNVPGPLFGVWRTVWLVLLAPIVLALCLLTIGGYFLGAGVPAWIVGLISSALVLAIGLGAFRTVSLALTRSFVTAGFVDVARYLDPLPQSYAAPSGDPGRLVDLLYVLQQGRFARVVVVGHGLGAYIAYDALIALWAETHAVHATVDRVARRARHPVGA